MAFHPTSSGGTNDVQRLTGPKCKQLVKHKIVPAVKRQLLNDPTRIGSISAHDIEPVFRGKVMRTMRAAHLFILLMPAAFTSADAVPALWKQDKQACGTAIRRWANALTRYLEQHQRRSQGKKLPPLPDWQDMFSAEPSLPPAAAGALGVQPALANGNNKRPREEEEDDDDEEEELAEHPPAAAAAAAAAAVGLVLMPPATLTGPVPPPAGVDLRALLDEGRELLAGIARDDERCLQLMEEIEASRRKEIWILRQLEEKRKHTSRLENQLLIHSLLRAGAKRTRLSGVI